MLSLRRIPFVTCKRCSLGLFCFLFAVQVKAQKDSLINADTASLQQVTVTAFSTYTKWKDAPVAVAFLYKAALQRFGNTSLVPALNMVSGVRMEERSPGSYRLSIRGSLLRSPFGVRNVKVYYNDIPLTDAGGNTYLNLLDVEQLQSIEIIKGPAGSLYGSNTGGAVLLQSNTTIKGDYSLFNAGVSYGSYNTLKENINWQYTEGKFSSSLSQSHQQSDGYRQQSAMRRDALQWNAKLLLNDKASLSALLFYTDLQYEIPGGLTQAQMDSLPTLARQPTTSLPGAVQQKTAVYNKTVFAGFTFNTLLGKNFFNTTSVVLSHTGFENPFITNYEFRDEFNLGGRTTIGFKPAASAIKFQWLNGFEWLRNKSEISNFGNLGGRPDTLQFKDEIFATQYFYFSQILLSPVNKISVQAGISVNHQQVKYARLSETENGFTTQSPKPTVAPRVSILYAITPTVSVYTIAAKGFSPPTLSEIRPSTGKFYDLQPEYGYNFEAGLKGFLFNGRFEFDAATYFFNIKNAIVRRTDNTGAEFFTNAGGTKQHGVELWTKAHLIKKNSGFIKTFDVSNGYSYQPYTFSNYIIGSTDYSGNRITGVPKNMFNAAMDVNTRYNVYSNISFQSISSIPLNDGNTVVADAYQLVQFKLGYRHQLKDVGLHTFFFIDNLLNQSYSLGNDINAFGGRYFNPAAKRNYQAGVALTF